MSRYATYEKFFNPEQAAPVLSVLKEQRIPHEFAAIGKQVDQLITGGGPAYLYEVRMPADQFETVNRLLREKMHVHLDDIDPDHYLFSFDDIELVEILKKPDEWGRLDYAIAREILESRGIVYTNEELDGLWNKRMETLARPATDGGRWITAGYFFSVVGGFIGILIGLVLMQSTKTLPNGSRYYIYDKRTRRNGKTILFISVIVTAINLTLALTRSFTIVKHNWIGW
ncbi:hypothetical protein [Longitalea luteola]|uniref:hypothetical protein n=1 Tax=Longitalea luteola TaxID=2812563 RepID=UPI001A95F45B|nr:hypothetical protein [Longitalea luteola]